VHAPGQRVIDATGNLLWTWGEGRPRLLVAAHVDTVFSADTKLSVRREGEDLVGPGVGDNAAAVAVAVNVFEEALRGGGVGPGAVAFTVCEEGLGNLRGASAACDRLDPLAFVALEGHGLDKVLVDAVGSVRARIVVRGPGGHSWADRGAPSAVHAALGLGAAMIADPVGKASVNIGQVAGGRSVNSIADEAELVVEARSVEEAQLDSFADELQRIVVSAPLELTVELLGRRPSGRLSRGAPLLRLVRGVRDELGLPDVLEAGSTDANAALAKGIPALALGVARGSGMHTLGERIELDSVELGCRQLEEVLTRRLRT
jgi:acetylornithine deacetylase/succinyl-diaminopimelate desuccinylase-like protein